MARTIRRQPREDRGTSYHPTKRARLGERRSSRQATRRALREYAR